MADAGMRPSPVLSPEQLEQINDAIVDGFDLGELTRMLRFKWGLVLANYINTKQGNYDIVSDLIAWTERRGKTRELVALAYAENSGNLAVQQVARSLGLTLLEVRQKYDTTKALSGRPSLEAMVARHSRFINYDKFLTRFQSLGARVCRIETPYKLGTGFLVGPNLVLTNFHVIESVTTLAQAAHSVCQFDYHTADDDGASRSKVSVHFDREWLVAKSPYSISDVRGVGEPAMEELDYALIRLADEVGSVQVSADNTRGWFDLNAERPLLAIRDFVVIPQHPKGRALEVAWGAVLEFNPSSTRVRYDTSTEVGSSGSPCLTVDLDLFALHHSTDPSGNVIFNEAVPLDLIAKDLKSKSIF
jgi:Trypsin-like peptidase domain/Effector-associated domain 1